MTADSPAFAAADPGNPVGAGHDDLRRYGLSLCETKRIDSYAYHKARYRLYEGDENVQRAVIAWLEEQPDWTDAEFMHPGWVLEEYRDMEMIDRESRAYKRSIGIE